MTLMIDCGWTKRSYKYGFNSLAACMPFIDNFTKKLVHIEIICKFCSDCNKELDDKKEHICYKNFEGSSTAMEPEMAKRGILEIYKKYDIQTN